MQLLTSVEPFQYHQHGGPHLGYYDPLTRLFAAVADDRLITTFRTRPAYVEGLRRSTS